MDDPAWLDREQFPFSSRFADVDGCRVHYVDEGSGPLLFFLHGNPTWSFTWREVIRGLRDRCRCVALDLPGFGLSTARAGYDFEPPTHAEVVERFVEALDLRDATLVVQDWGGPIGFAAAERAPERFTRFVIGNTWAWPMTGNRGARIFSAVLGGPIGRYLITRRNFFVERIVPAGVNRGKLESRVLDQYRGPFPTPESRRPVAVMPRAIVGQTPWLAEVERGLSRLSDRPALIVWPDADRAFRVAERERFEQLFDDHRTVILAGAGHYIGEDAPEEIVEAVRSWI